MAVTFCTKEKGSCNKCEHYKKDKDRNRMACFLKEDSLKIKNPTIKDYLKAIEDGNIEIAQELYKKIFAKQKEE